MASLLAMDPRTRDAVAALSRLTVSDRAQVGLLGALGADETVTGLVQARYALIAVTRGRVLVVTDRVESLSPPVMIERRSALAAPTLVGSDGAATAVLLSESEQQAFREALRTRRSASRADEQRVDQRRGSTRTPQGTGTTHNRPRWEPRAKPEPRRNQPRAAPSMAPTSALPRSSGPALCRKCGRPLVVVSGRCVLCGTKKKFLQSAPSALTRKGGIKKARRLIVDNAIASAAMTWQDAEMVCCDWMTKHGYPDARVTPAGADGGVDITSKKAVGQVKHHAKPVGIADVQRLYGVAVGSGRKALFFSGKGYTKQALAWARQNGVECYCFPPVTLVE